MALLKNIHLLTGMSDDNKMKMEHAALMHGRYNNISFKIKEMTGKTAIIQVQQGKNPSGNYFNKKRLIEIIHETFDRFFRTMK